MSKRRLRGGRKGGREGGREGGEGGREGGREGRENEGGYTGIRMVIHVCGYTVL